MLKCEVIGNVVRDAEERTTKTGVNVCSFTVAVKDKRDKDKTYFIKVSAWRKLSEICGKFVKKGMKIYVCGNPDVQTYTNNKGEFKADLCITADDVEFLSRTDNGERNDHEDNGYRPDDTHDEPKFTDVSSNVGDELPF